MHPAPVPHPLTPWPLSHNPQGVHSREFEVGVLNWFARLWEIDEEEYWGYITNCGTEGNLHGILVGRENLPDGGWMCVWGVCLSGGDQIKWVVCW